MWCKIHSVVPWETRLKTKWTKLIFLELSTPLVSCETRRAPVFKRELIHHIKKKKTNPDQCRTGTGILFLPAEASDQDAHDDWTEQTSNSEDRHGERVHEGQGLLAESGSITINHRLVVKVLYVLRSQGMAGEGGRGGQEKGKWCEREQKKQKIHDHSRSWIQKVIEVGEWLKERNGTVSGVKVTHFVPSGPLLSGYMIKSCCWGDNWWLYSPCGSVDVRVKSCKDIAFTVINPMTRKVKNNNFSGFSYDTNQRGRPM